MKKDRDCGMTPYPVYPNVGMPVQNTMMPNMGMPGMPQMQGMMPNIPMYGMPTYNTNATQSQSMDNLERQINMLDRRVTKLETLVNSASTYNSSFNDSNYHVM